MQPQRPPYRVRASAAWAVTAFGLLASWPSLGQPAQELSWQDVPSDLTQSGAPASAALRRMTTATTQEQAAQPGVRMSPPPVDLGERLSAEGVAHDEEVVPTAPSTPALRAAQAAVHADHSGVRNAAAQGGTVRHVRRAHPAGRSAGRGTERAVFEREPVRITLAVGQERLVTLPAPVALHVPVDMDQVARLETIDRTIYLTALVPFAPLRIRAELIDTGQQIPLDLVAHADTGEAAPAELEVSVVPPRAPSGGSPTTQEDPPEATPPSVDMVQLTRHAARQIYAPRRLAWPTPGVHQVDVRRTPMDGLIRGANVLTQPLGQWKSGPLYVTAVLVKNRSKYPQEIVLEQLRGRWIAATAQHGRMGPAGSETDNTAIYLVCDRSFEACL